MPSIPHGFHIALSGYAAPLVALLAALVLPLARQIKGVAAPLALFAGWALLPPLAELPRSIWAPHRGTEALLAPALAGVAGLAWLAWRGGRHPRLTAGLMAAFAGWWVARDGVGDSDFWRVWFAVAVLAAGLGRVIQGRADRLMVLAAALWGGLAVAGAGQGWLMAALAAAAAALGLVASGTTVPIPLAAVAALIGTADLAGGRLLRGRLDATDAACIACLLAPWVSDAASKRLLRLPGPLAAVSARAMGVGGTVGAVWLLRRAFFT